MRKKSDDKMDAKMVKGFKPFQKADAKMDKKKPSAKQDSMLDEKFAKGVSAKVRTFGKRMKK